MPPPPPPAAPASTSDKSKTVTKKKWKVDLPVERDWKDIYPFHAAAQGGQTQVLIDLLDSTSIDLDALDDDGWSALHYASWYSHTDVVASLLERKANVNILNSGNATPLHFAAGVGLPIIAQKLLDAQADVTLLNKEKQTPLQLAMELKPEQLDSIVALLR